ncbi:flagellar hook-associated protein 1 [mine drainage metagenome]|uniref:Flagellar hook-associated protein 1 n=1 Tax=mine drainage metagenome TaxID=410659 RepID=A0A1J5RN01_9ZZZZ
MSGILSIGQSALNAAQVGLSVTGHNIANVNTPGYSRQVVVQAAAQAQNTGSGSIGQGTEISGVSRTYNEILASQLISSQSASKAADTYNTQLTAINNMLSDASAGINPAMNNFFASVQDLSANPSDIPTRQTMLSNAQSLVNTLHSTGSRLNEISDSVNSQLSSSTGLVNVYARQIASLNDTIEKTVNAGAGQPNDLLDQRDQLVLELSKQIKTTVVPQGQGSYNIYIGNGLPLVIGVTTMSLTTTGSSTDPSRLEVAYQSNGKSTVLGASSLPGGAIGGLLQFRNESLDPAQSQIGQVAVALATDFNTQHKLGIDLNGNAGTNLFNVPAPAINANSNNTGSASIAATIVDTSAMTSSDYRVDFDGTAYSVTRLSDGAITTPVTFPQTIDGLNYSISGTMAAGDQFIVRPTRNAATTMSVAISDARKLAIGSTTAPGDNTNGLLLAGLQSKTTMNNNTTSYSSAYGQLVNSIGNKSRELTVTAAAEAQVLTQNTASMQSESGVNLDEEAANLIRYQQAYQAAGKMMQIASQLFDTLLQIGK